MWCMIMVISTLVYQVMFGANTITHNNMRMNQTLTETCKLEIPAYVGTFDYRMFNGSYLPLDNKPPVEGEHEPVAECEYIQDKPKHNIKVKNWCWETTEKITTEYRVVLQKCHENG